MSNNTSSKTKGVGKTLANVVSVVDVARVRRLVGGAVSCLVSVVLPTACVFALAVVAGACDDDQPASKKPAASTPSDLAAPVLAVDTPKRMTEVTITPTQALIGNDELSSTAANFEQSFRGVLKKYPVDDPERVIVNVDRKVKTSVASRAFYALVDAGAKSIEVRTKPRGEFPESLVVSSDKTVDDAIPGCTNVGMVLGNLSAVFWKKQGGLAKRYAKGMAGPDFSAMNVVMHRDSKTCLSKVFLFTAVPDIEWGHCFDLAGSVKSASPPYEYVDRFVLLRSEPVPGKPVKINH